MTKVMTPNEIVEAGERIYAESFRDLYEGQYDGQFLAIDVASAEVYLGEFPEDALGKAESANPAGSFYLVKIGAAGTFTVGYVGEHERDVAWPLQPAA
ncbi:MAG: hypothetical protein OXE50_14205 [Chloroflexi bacterium]|nr:hypothetical protein [Chloroflexota bacterium]